MMPWGPGTASLVLGIPARRRGSNVGITAVVLTASHLLLMTYDESILRAAGVDRERQRHALLTPRLLEEES